MSLIFYTGNTLDQTLQNDQKLSGRIITSLESWGGVRNGVTNGNSNGHTYTKGTSNGNSNGCSNGTGNGILNGNSNGITNGTTNSIANGTSNGTLNHIPTTIPPISFHKSSSESLEHSDITAKLFLPLNINPDKISDILKQIISITTSNNLLPDQKIKHFIISLEGLTFSSDDKENSPSNDKIYTIWKSLIKTITSIDSNLIEQYGISELSTEKLTELLAKLESQNITVPSIDQINATDCCALPPGLLSIAKKRHIRLLAHHDPDEMLPAEAVESVLQEYSSITSNPTTTSSWDWILRLTYIARDRQVLTGNEYLVSISPSN